MRQKISRLLKSTKKKTKTVKKPRVKKSKARFTVGYTYFDEPHKLKQQFEIWKKWPAEVDIILVDDGSDHSPAKDVIDEVGFKLEDYQPNFRLFKVTRNLGFNSHGCRNLIAKYAGTDFIMFMDIDMNMYENDIAYLKIQKFNPEKIYYNRQYGYDDQKMSPAPGHENCFIIHKDLYWDAGGYDESFTGYHYGDWEFHERIKQLQEERKTSPRWEDTGCSITLTRKGRHGSVRQDPELTLGRTTHYVDDELFYQTIDNKDVAKLKGTKKTVIDFPFIEVL